MTIDDNKPPAPKTLNTLTFYIMMNNFKETAAMKQKEIYGTNEVAKILGVSPTTVWKWCKEGKIKCGKTPGGHFRIPRSEVERLLKEIKGE